MLTLEERLLKDITDAGLPDPLREHCFALEAMGRRWRFDFCFPEQKVAVEVDGGTWVKGRHTTGAGFEKDAEKMNSAVLLGWRVLRFTGAQIKRGEAIDTIRKAMEQ